MTERIRNTKMRDAFENLARAVWNILRRSRESRVPLLTRKRKIVSWQSYGAIIGSRDEYNLDEFLSRHMSIIRKIPEFERCIEALRKDEIVNNHLENRIGAFTRASLLQTPSIPELFLKHLMIEVKGFDLRTPTILKVYEMMEDFFYNDTIAVEVFVHLEGFTSETEELDLGQGWSISKIPQDTFNKLLTDGLLEDYPHMSRYALMWKLVVPKLILKGNEPFDSPSEYQNYQGTVRQIVSALRVFKSGDIGFRRIKMQFKGWNSEVGGMSHSYKKQFWGNTYSLEKPELHDFRTLLNLLQENFSNPVMIVAIDRLNYAVERERQYDIILDYMIAFETLLLFKHDKKRPTLPRRVAKMISTSDDERSAIDDDMGLAYDLRNSIAHGDTESETRKILQDMGRSKKDFTKLIGNHLRRAIRGYLIYLSKNFSKEQIIKELHK